MCHDPARSHMAQISFSKHKESWKSMPAELFFFFLNEQTGQHPDLLYGITDCLM